MLTTAEYLINMSITVCYIWFIYRIIESSLKLRPQRWIRVLFFAALFLICNPKIFSQEVTGSLCLLLFLFLLLTLVCTNPFAEKLTFTMFLYPIWASVSYLTEDIGLIIWLYGFQTHMDPAGELLLHSATTILRIPFWAAAWHVIKKQLPVFPTGFPAKIQHMILLMYLAPFLGIIIMIAITDSETSFIIWPACIACILTNLGIFYVCSCLSRSLRSEMEVEILRLRQNYDEEAAAEQEKTRKLRHDIKNHLSVIQILLKNGQQQEAAAYLKNLSQEWTGQIRSFCDNPVINAVLNAKYHRAAACSVSCEFHLDLGNDLNRLTDPIALCSLFANTLDNAIEACCKIEEPLERKILLKARCTDGFFSCSIENSKAEPVRRADGLFQTGKKEKESHGFGLQNVKDLVQCCRGTLDISYTEHWFSVAILIPLGESDE